MRPRTATLPIGSRGEAPRRWAWQHPSTGLERTVAKATAQAGRAGRLTTLPAVRAQQTTEFFTAAMASASMTVGLLSFVGVGSG